MKPIPGFILLITRPPKGYEAKAEWASKPLYLRATAIEAVAAHHEGGSTVQIAAHPNGGWQVRESPEAVLSLIKEAQPC